jgi:hypothetical protein
MVRKATRADAVPHHRAAQRPANFCWDGQTGSVDRGGVQARAPQRCAACDDLWETAGGERRERIARESKPPLTETRGCGHVGSRTAPQAQVFITRTSAAPAPPG